MLFIHPWAPEFFNFFKIKCHLEVKLLEKSIFSTKQTCIEIIFSSRIQIFSFLSVMVWPLEHLVFFQGQKVYYPVARHDICYLIFFTFNIDLRKTFGEIKNLLYWFHNIAIRISYFCMVASWLVDHYYIRTMHIFSV